MVVGIDNISPGTSTSSSRSLGSMRLYLLDLLTLLPPLFPHWQFKLFTPEWNEPFEVSHPNLEMVFCAGAIANRPMRVMFEQFKLPGIIRRAEIDIWLGTCNVLPLAMRCPSLLLVHSHQFYTHPDTYGWPRGAWLRFIVRLSVRKATVVGVQSHDAENTLRRFVSVPEGRIRVIYNRLVDVGQPDSCAPRIKRPYLLYASGLYPFKNHRRLIAAFAGIRKDFPGIALILAGGGDDRALRRQVSALGLDGDVVFFGRADRECLADLYRNATASVFPSLEETFGLSILEAMSVGCPVVTSNRSSMKEIAGDAALLVDPEDCDAIATGLRRVLTDHQLRQDLIRSGRVRCSHFTRQNTISAMAAALSDIHSPVTYTRERRQFLNNGSPGYTGTRLHLYPRLAAVRAEETPRTGQDDWKSDDRIPTRAN